MGVEDPEQEGMTETPRPPTPLPLAGSLSKIILRHRQPLFLTHYTLYCLERDSSVLFFFGKCSTRTCPEPCGPEVCASATIGLPDSSVGKESACNAGDPGLILGSGRSAGEGIGYPLQYSWASLVAQLVKNPPEMRVT